MNKKKYALIFCDIQKKIMPHIFNSNLIIQSSHFLYQNASHSNSKIQHINSYSLLPDKLGPCLLSEKYHLNSINKSTYSVVNNELLNVLNKQNIDHVILTGVETHWCIYQSAYDLLNANKKVIIPKDAVGSQHKDDHESALNQLYKDGCVETTTKGLVSQFYDTIYSDGVKKYISYLKK